MVVKETSGVSGKYELEKKKQTVHRTNIREICGRDTRRILSTLVPGLVASGFKCG